jgi:riboflavin synthase
VETTTEVLSLEKSEGFCRVIFQKPKGGVLTPKGSVTINGVSLTVNEVGGTSFSIMLIPHTLERTNLFGLTKKSLVNVEYDFLQKQIAEQVRAFLIDQKMEHKNG